MPFPNDLATDGSYLLTSTAELCKLAAYVNADNDCAGMTFKLANDIDLTGVDFTPIGDSTNYFSGTFDGDGHTISNLRISSSSDCVGLFGSVDSGGTIKNVNLSNAKISGNEDVGGLVGENSGTIQNCTANDTVSGNEHVGGLVGFNGGKIRDCTANTTVNGNEYVGSLGGFNNGAVDNCTANVDEAQVEQLKLC